MQLKISNSGNFHFSGFVGLFARAPLVKILFLTLESGFFRRRRGERVMKGGELWFYDFFGVFSIFCKRVMGKRGYMMIFLCK